MRSAVTLPQGTIAYSDTGRRRTARGPGPRRVRRRHAVAQGRAGGSTASRAASSPTCRSARTARRWTPDADLSPPGLANLIADFLAALDLERRHPRRQRHRRRDLPARRHPPSRADRAPRAHPLRRLRELPPAGVPLPPGAREGPGRVDARRAAHADPGGPPRADRVRLAREAAGSRATCSPTGPSRSSTTAPCAPTRARSCAGSTSATRSRPRSSLRDFAGPTMLAWATEDRFFKPKFAERLAADIPGSRLEWIEDARTFVSEDQPERLAALIARVRDRLGAALRRPRRTSAAGRRSSGACT